MRHQWVDAIAASRTPRGISDISIKRLPDFTTAGRGSPSNHDSNDRVVWHERDFSLWNPCQFNSNWTETIAGFGALGDEILIDPV